MRTWKASLLAGLLLAGCAETAVVSRPKGPVALSFSEAQEVVKGFESKQAAADAADPLRAPRSLDDVTEILKRDQMDLFQGAIDFAAKDASPQARALQAQIELAWGEAQQILANQLGTHAEPLRKEVRRLEIKKAAGELSADEVAQLAEISAALREKSDLGEAFAVLSAEHVAAGSKIARELLASAPNDYVGHRLAADVHHLRQDWVAFDGDVAKLKALKPDSNGLLFLEGVALQERDGDLGKADAKFEEALKRDPKFTRAQVQRVLSQPDFERTYAEFKKLETLSPRHQLVVYAGDLIAAAQKTQLRRKSLQRQVEVNQARTFDAAAPATTAR